MRPNGNGNHGGNNFNRRPRNNNQGGGNRGGGGGNMRRPQQPTTNLRNQIFDSHGPNGERVRGNAFQVHEKYQSLARDAEERVDQEAYSQHAEHYYRIVEAIQEMEAERQARFGSQPNAQPSEGQQRQQNNYQNQQGERSDSYGGDQPDIAAPVEGDAGDMQQQQRPRFNRDNNRDQGRDQDRNQGREQNRRPRDEQAPNEEPSRRQPRAAPQERAPLEPIVSSESDDSGPIFSIAGDAPPAEPVEIVEAPAPRRRGRPAKTETE